VRFRRDGLLGTDSDSATVAGQDGSCQAKAPLDLGGCGVGAGDLKAPALVAYGSLTTPVNVPPPVPGGTNTSPVVTPWPVIPA
jgi:hypothetical protein